MYRFLRSAALAAAATLGLWACKKEYEEPTAHQLIPLKIGNSWEYQLYRYDTTGAITDSSRYVRSVLRDTLINRSTWYILSDRSIVQNDRQGYLFFNKASQQPLIQYPSAEQGNIGYGYTYPNYTLWLLTTRDQDPMPVPASRNHYSAVRYKVEYQYLYTGQTKSVSTWREEYVSPDFGLVRADYYSTAGRLQRRLELQNFFN